MHSTYPAPFTSIQLYPPPPSSIYLHEAHFNLYPALCNTLSVTRTKTSHVIWQFSQILVKKTQCCPFSLKEYFEDADTYSDISFLNFQPLSPFLGKVRPRKWNCLFLLILIHKVSWECWFISSEICNWER